MKKNVFLPLNLGYFICEQHTDYLDNSVIIEVKVKYIVKVIRRVLIYAAKDLKDCMDRRKRVFKVTNIKSLFV